MVIVNAKELRKSVNIPMIELVADQSPIKKLKELWVEARIPMALKKSNGKL